MDGDIASNPSDGMVGGMFGTFSQRARQVPFAARVNAGQRGEEVMGVDDLIVGLIIEGQGTIFCGAQDSTGKRANDDCFFVIEKGIGKILTAATIWAVPMPVSYTADAAENAPPTH